jgi:hypothetical protein
MDSTSECSCKTVLGLGKEYETPIVCHICKCTGVLTVCDTNRDGFVCGKDDCKYILRLQAIFSEDVFRINPIDLIIEVVHSPVTDAFMLKTSTGVEPLDTPERFAFKLLDYYKQLVRPDHKYVVKMTFADLTNMRSYDDPIDTIYIEFKKPIEQIVGDDGEINSYCFKWYTTCIHGGNISMCKDIPVKLEGRHRITLYITDMTRIV